MLFMPPNLQSVLDQISQHLPPPFYKDIGFYVSLVIGGAGLIFSILAWTEAKKAKKAATAAGRTVKLQTVTIELSEIGQKLDRVQPGIRFNEARDLLADTSRRVHRATAPFSKEPKLSEAIEAAKQAVQGAQNSLKSVRPSEPVKEAEAPDAVYYGIETDCSAISSCVADLIGLFEKQAFDFGDKNGDS
jgi:hypothetical protein